MDISYLPMATDFICLAAAIDWPTRSVLSWRLTFLLLASHTG